MAAIAVRFQGPKNSARALAGLSSLIISSNIAARALSSGCLIGDTSAAQLLRAIPLTSLCETLLCWIPAGANFASLWPWLDLFTTAARILLNAF